MTNLLACIWFRHIGFSLSKCPAFVSPLMLFREMDKGRKDPNWERKTLTTVVTENRVEGSGLSKLFISESIEDSIKFWNPKLLQLLYASLFLFVSLSSSLYYLLNP